MDQGDGAAASEFHRHRRQILSAANSLQKSAVGMLATQLGWTLQSIGVATDGEVDDSLSARLNGLRIAIYSLTEPSSRQAKKALEHVASSVTIDISSDHGGTARLRALAEDADLFVIVWRSAKHATEFIREIRKSKPIIYVDGKGVSSILGLSKIMFSRAIGSTLFQQECLAV